MAVLISALLAIAVVIVVLYPFIRARLSSNSLTDTEQDVVLPSDMKQTIYEEIETLRLEHELGRVDGGEYKQRLDAYRIRAAQSLRDVEILESDLDQSLEKEIQTARERMNNGALPREGKPGRSKTPSQTASEQNGEGDDEPNS